METVILGDGTNCLRFMERSDEDGGLVLVTMVPDGVGGYFVHRNWIGHGIHNGVPPTQAQRQAAQGQARATFNSMQLPEIESRAALARQTEVTNGSLAFR